MGPKNEHNTRPDEKILSSPDKTTSTAASRLFSKALPLNGLLLWFLRVWRSRSLPSPQLK